MPALARDIWVILRLVARPDGIWLTYRDSTGDRRDPPATGASHNATLRNLLLPPLPLVPFPGGVWVPVDFDDLLTALLSRMSPGDTLPVFVEPPPAVKGFAWELTLRYALPPVIEPQRISIVRLGPGAWRRRAPLELPFRIVAAGSDTRDVLKPLEQAGWYGDDVRGYGLAIETAEPAALAQVMRTPGQDVLVAGQHEIEAALNVVQQMRPVLRPRLVLYPHHGPINWLMTGGIDPPAGTAFAEIAAPPPLQLGDQVREFFLQVIHDLPLHEAIRVFQYLAPPNSESILIADPFSNHSLRLSAAAPGTLRKVASLGPFISAGNVEAFVARISPDSPVRDALATTLRKANPHEAMVSAARDSANALRVDFLGERRGLVPLAEVEARLAAANGPAAALHDTLAELSKNPDFAREIEQVQHRQVDVALDEMDPFIGVFRPIDSFEPLEPAREYRLNVHIGHRGPHSLVSGEPPPIDPLLPEVPDQAGHDIEIAVFATGFRVRSPRVKRLKLPRLGGTDPVYFNVVAPPHAGAAQLRIGVYHRNHLLQSFRLEARVSEQREYSGVKQVDVKLDYSRSTRLANVDRIMPREICIGVNQNAGTATHSFMVKKDDTAGRPINIAERVMEDKIADFRRALKEETYAAKDQPRFSAYPAAGSEKRPEFQRAVARFAKLGRDLYRFLHGKADQALQDRLTELRNASNRTIQIVRHDANFVFPWTAIYDYPLPAGDSAPVCMGGAVAKDAPPAPQGRKLPRGCPHRPGEDVFCVEGFWAVRHKIEQLIDNGGDPVDWVDAAGGGSEVCLAAGIDDMPARDLAGNLKKKITRFVECTPPFQKEDLLWEPKQRPALLVLLSHMEEPKPAKYQLSLVASASGEDYALTPDFIDDGKIQWGKWAEQPRTLVLLMACESAATDLKTLNDFVKSFNGAGASAVIGTETEVFSGLAARFAEEVTLAMRNGAALGDAVQDFNRRLFQLGNPLALAFTCCGNTDLILK